MGIGQHGTPLDSGRVGNGQHGTPLDSGRVGNGQHGHYMFHVGWYWTTWTTQAFGMMYVNSFMLYLVT